MSLRQAVKQRLHHLSDYGSKKIENMQDIYVERTFSATLMIKRFSQHVDFQRE